MKHSIAAVSILAALLLATPALAGEDADKKTDGKAVFLAQMCNLCHSVPAAEIKAKTKSDKLKGPDLDGKVEGEFETIAAYLRKKSDDDDKKPHKKEFKGTDEELQTILDWLGSLEAQE